jgi:hypothetical protein
VDSKTRTFSVALEAVHKSPNMPSPLLLLPPPSPLLPSPPSLLLLLQEERFMAGYVHANDGIIPPEEVAEGSVTNEMAERWLLLQQLQVEYYSVVPPAHIERGLPRQPCRVIMLLLELLHAHFQQQ